MAKPQKNQFEDLDLSLWESSRNTIHLYAKLLGKIRAVFTPKQKHWWNVSLRVSAGGLTTTPIAVPDQNKSIELELNFVRHKIIICSSLGERQEITLKRQSIHKLYKDVLWILASMNAHPKLDDSLFSGEEDLPYDQARIESFWYMFAQLDLIFKEFKGDLREESSPVQLWPQIELSQGAFWETNVFNGAILKYKELTQTADPKRLLISFLKTVQNAGSEFMLKQ
jgi:hypothetical protein